MYINESLLPWEKKRTTTKKNTFKVVSVTQAASCCSIQSFDLNDMAIDPYRV